MTWLSRHAWWGLLAVSVLLLLFGATDIASGAAADALIPKALTGKTIEELEAESADAYGMFDSLCAPMAGASSSSECCSR